MAGFVKLTDYGLFSAFLHEDKPLKLHTSAIKDLRDFVVNSVNLTKPPGLVEVAEPSVCGSDAPTRYVLFPSDCTAVSNSKIHIQQLLKLGFSDGSSHSPTKVAHQVVTQYRYPRSSLALDKAASTPQPLI